MESLLIQELLRHRADILREWSRLLHDEPVATPLGLPACLDHMMGLTFDTVVSRLCGAPGHEPGRPGAEAVAWPPDCRCGRNPFLAYYQCGDRAFASVLDQGLSASLLENGRAAREALRELGLEEIGGFGALCQLVSKSNAGGCCDCETKR